MKLSGGCLDVSGVPDASCACVAKDLFWTTPQARASPELALEPQQSRRPRLVGVLCTFKGANNNQKRKKSREREFKWV